MGPREFNNPTAGQGAGGSRAPTFTAVGRDDACAATTIQARPGEKIDIILVVDNSGSMDMEIAAIRSNINRNFASLIAASGVDYRVVVVSAFGDGGQNLCVEPPLSGAPCAEGVANAISTRFFHYDTRVQSLDPWCRVLQTFDEPDALGLAPEGWGKWLRREARKVFVVFTDDSASCTWFGPDGAVSFDSSYEDPVGAAVRFHEALLARSPAQFGQLPDVRYTWYSVVGMRGTMSGGAPSFPYDPLQDEICGTATSPGTAYQALSVMTDALRYPVCEGRGFDGVFRALSRGVIRTAKADCAYAVPEQDGLVIDTTTVNVEYRAGGQTEGRPLPRLPSAAACADEGFYLDGDRIRLCPESCATIRADDNARVDVLFGCGPEGPG